MKFWADRHLSTPCDIQGIPSGHGSHGGNGRYHDMVVRTAVAIMGQTQSLVISIVVVLAVQVVIVDMVVLVVHAVGEVTGVIGVIIVMVVMVFMVLMVRKVMFRQRYS